MTIAVLMGGRSAEHEISLMSGGAMLAALSQRDFPNIRAVTVSRDHQWSADGTPATFARALEDVDVALLAFHGEWGEDGRAQALMEWIGLPYNGSRPTASALAMDKPVSRVLLREHGLAIPQGSAHVRPGDRDAIERLAEGIARAHPFPLVVKPASRGSSVGVTLVRTARQLVPALHEAFRYDNRALVEKYLDGIEVSCGVLEELSGELKALPVAQIIPPRDHALFDFHAKYSGEAQELVPAPLAPDVARRVAETALAAHFALGCRHYSRTDMIILNGRPIVLELNTLPGLTPESILPKEALAAGLSYPALIERLVGLASRDRTQ
ncbi:MAG: D-alanine--D-alanine ligase [Candidatus Terrybacteria bacterium]|nr:D-alanine--D-alanine ligase [Candidatus Terrybacteria bacterium]